MIIILYKIKKITRNELILSFSNKGDERKKKKLKNCGGKLILEAQARKKKILEEKNETESNQSHLSPG